MTKAGIIGTLLVLIALVGWRAQPTWIEISETPLFSGYFIVGRAPVSVHDIGRLGYVLSPPNHYGPETSNRLPVGTKIYMVYAKKPTEELAVELHPGDFVRATYAGTRRPW